MFGTHKPLVLLVDPDDKFRGDTCKALQKEGVEHVIEAMNGLEALVYFKTLDPYLVIMAADMPIKDGYSTCELIQSLPGGEKTAVLMLVEGDDYSAINKAYKSGSTDFERKPIEPRMLAKRAHYMLRARHKANDLHRNEQRINQAYRIANLGHWEWKVAENDFSISMEVARMLKSSRKVLRSVDDVISRLHDEDRQKFSETNVRVLEDGISRNVEVRVPLNNGRERVLVQWVEADQDQHCLLYTSPSPRDLSTSRMPSSA